MYIDDRVLKKNQNENKYCFAVYEAERTEVILGRSCSAEDDVHVSNCKQGNVPIRKRLGGGGTVLLSKGIIIISAAGVTSIPFQLIEHMNAVNNTIIHILTAFGVKNLAIRGISDIALDHRKILGSSLARRKDLILYQGCLLVNPDLKLFDIYLNHPKKEPDYRKGRTHREFLTTLWNEGYKINNIDFISAIKEKLTINAPWSSLPVC